MALTASATPSVATDIINILQMENTAKVTDSFTRPNLFYEVRHKGKACLKDIAELILEKFKGQSGIIYCSSREKCEQFAMKLRDDYRLSAKHFHAQMDPVSKRETQDKWSSGECQIIVATVGA